MRGFPGGVAPPSHKAETAAIPILVLPLPTEIILPLADRLRSAETRVAVRETVQTGQKLAQGTVAIRSPVDGQVIAIADRPWPDGRRGRSLVIRVSGQTLAPVLEPLPAGRTGLLELLREAGLVGMGGAAFPAPEKLGARGLTDLILNGSECEPYLTADERLLIEDAEGVLRGGEVLRRAAGAVRVYAAVERGRADSLAALRRAARKFPRVRVVVLPSRYPQGAERLLVQSVLGRRLPAGAFPQSVGALVHNVQTAWAAGRAAQGFPLLDRVITVAGVGFTRPGNYRVPLGTPLSHVLKVAGYDGSADRLLLGGPLTGRSLGNLEIPVLAGTSGIIALGPGHRGRAPDPCLRCGRCLSVCPVGLEPVEIMERLVAGETQGLGDLHPEDCLECGSCAYACPSRRPLLEYLRLGKEEVRRWQRA